MNYDKKCCKTASFRVLVAFVRRCADTQPYGYNIVRVHCRCKGISADSKCKRLFQRRIRNTSNENGYFELPCHLGDVVYFSCVGYQKVTFPVPDSLIGRNRVIGILMSADTIMLGEVVVLPKIDFERIEYEVTHLPPDVEKQVATVNVSEAINTALTTSATYSDEGPENQLSAYTMRLEYAGMIPPDKSFTFIGTNSGIVRYLMVSREQKRRVEQTHTKYSPSRQKQLQMIEDVRKFVEDKSEN